MAAGIRRAGFDEVIELPLADGGEGTLDTLLAARGGSRRTARVTGPLGDPVDAEWGVLPGGVAIIEMAQASGLALVHDHNDPLRASTRGTGELIAAVRAQGFNRVVVAVGGSATTDGGLAAVEALGWSLQGMKVTVACDVETSFADAAKVFGPQKGASGAQVALLTRRLKMLSDRYRARTGIDVAQLTGALTGLATGAVAYVLYGLAQQGWMMYVIIIANFLSFAAGPALQAGSQVDWPRSAPSSRRASK